ncbi:hypothetical protein RV420_330090 [Roseovarius sp. EC-SD190]|nr:hypothetical protein RV420_330090 [Roseovarius sp. EC-SD190]
MVPMRCCRDGKVARTGLIGVFIVNTAENIINTLECPVVALNPDDFTSPVDQQSRTAES